MESKDPESLSLKITDFGFACFFQPGEGKKEILGSPLYMAPEIIHGDSYDARVDIWSTGVITYILLCGRPPYKGKTREEIFNCIKHQPLAFEGATWAKISDEAKDFIRHALAKEPADRATA